MENSGGDTVVRMQGEPVHFHVSSGKEFSNMSGYGTIDTYDRKDERERNYEADRT